MTKIIFDKLILSSIFIFFIIYNLQDILYNSGTSISKISLFYILSISTIYFFKTLFSWEKRNTFTILWTLLLLLNIIGYFFTADFNNTFQNSMFKNILGCMLPFYPIYYFSSKYKLNTNIFILFLLIMLIISIFQFYNNEKLLLYESIFNDINIVNNVAYSFVMLIPYVFFIKKYKLFSGVIVLIIISFIILGAKRGAIITGLVGLIIFLFTQFRLKKKKVLIDYLILIILTSFISLYSYYSYTNNAFIMERMTSITEGDYSSRNIIFGNIFNSWYNSDRINNLIFGFGFGSSLELSKMNLFAHNDWLELLSNFGIIGITIYLLIFYSSFKYIFNINISQEKRNIMLVLTLIWLLTTMFSMWYTSIGSSIQTILLGYLIGNSGFGTPIKRTVLF